MRNLVLRLLLVLAALAFSACGSDDIDSQADAEELDDAESDEGEDAIEPDTGETGTDDAESDEGAADVDLSLTRDDVDCSGEELNGDSPFRFSTVHVVVDGVLGAPCLGEGSDTLYAAWDVLAIIAPTTARADLALFGGFEAADDGSEETTLAFVNPLDDDGTVFQMSINLASFEGDENESYLTVAHEFSHVFKLGPTQLDRAVLAEDCDTFDNGDGCFYEDALLAQWVAEFWTDDMLSDLDPLEEATGDVGAPRCDLNAEFLGAYAASNPDEDFAETFSAFVFGLEVDPAIAPKLEWMAQQPGLVEFRERAESAGLTPLENNFDLCG